MKRNLFADLPDSLDQELCEVLVGGRSFRVERIVSTGHASPSDFWYDQDQDEWVIVLAGEARLKFQGDAQGYHMKPGDHIHIPAHRKHRVDWTSPSEPTVWLAVFYSSSIQDSDR